MTSVNQKTRTRQTREQSRRRIVDAATELVRERSYGELNVGELMERAGFGRTIFYRHFDDLGDLILGASREAIEELYEAQLALGSTRADYERDSIREAIALAVAVYSRHGPLLRAITEAAAVDEVVAARQAQFRQRFDELVADALRGATRQTGRSFADVIETARALNHLNIGYLLDAFGREPRVSVETAVETLTGIWDALINR
jgi:TetR/AcrR family transcriptional regulator, ethionamide resistance regulator